MKKKFLLFSMIMLSFSIIFGGILFSCSAPGSSSGSGTSNGSLAISINDSVSTDTAPAVGGLEEDIFPTISMNPASYHIAGLGPNGATFEETTTGNSLVVNALAFGDWTLTITALNADGISIGVGSSTTTVQSNAISMVNVIVTPYDGLGTLDLSLAWTAGDVNTPQVVSTLQPNAGLTRNLDFTVAGASASFSADDVPTGYHTLVVKLLDNGILTMGAVDVVRIVADNTTSGSFLFDKINKATGTIEVGITPEMGDPLTVEIAGEADTKPENQSMSLTASVTNYADNVNYVWYVNGDSVETGATFNFESSWAQGYYRIDVTAYNTDGSRAGSDSVFIEVVDAVSTAPVAQISAGDDFTMILKTDGSLWATGKNSSGQFGNGTQINSNVPLQLISGGIQSVWAGGGYTMILKTDGSLWVSGYNNYGQFGNGTNTSSRVFLETMNSGALAVSTGRFYLAMILKTDGSLWATGFNSQGQLGIGTNTHINTPEQILNSGVQTVVTGGAHTMILKTDGSLWATGANGTGQLGNGTTTSTNVPIEIMVSDVQSIAAGLNHTMILKTDGSLWATGTNSDGQSGNGASPYSLVPVEIMSGGVQAVSCGESYSIILKTDGSLWATGLNNWGQLGNGTNTNSNVFVEIMSSGVQAISAGEFHAVILKTNGSLWATGKNTSGQLGDGTTTNSNVYVENIF